LQERKIAGAIVAEAEIRPRDDDLGAERIEVAQLELLRSHLSQLLIEPEHDDLLDAVLDQELDPALERGQELDVLA
jgi:hypothetical protein